MRTRAASCRSRRLTVVEGGEVVDEADEAVAVDEAERKNLTRSKSSGGEELACGIDGPLFAGVLRLTRSTILHNVHRGRRKVPTTKWKEDRNAQGRVKLPYPP